MNRRTFLKGLGAASLLMGCNPKASFGEPVTWHQAGVSELRAALDRGQVTPMALVQHFLDRIEEKDGFLRSILELNPNLEAEAARVSQLKAGVLRGIPVLIKDNIATGDGMGNSAGSAALASSRPAFSSGVAERLREEGAILLGKTNMSEWANFRSNKPSSGWSARGGQCRNPHALDRSPCGSSSGSAVAVAAELAPLAVGTETVGSILCPSGVCGIVGLKPTAHLLADDGIIPIAPSWETAGPMARTVSDVALLLQALVPDSRPYPLTPGALKGTRIGVARTFFGFDPQVDALMEIALEALRDLGAVLVDPVQVPTWKELGQDARTVMLYEFKNGLNAYLKRLGDKAPVKSLADVVTFNRENSKLEALSYFDQEVLLEAQAKGTLDEPEYRQALSSLQLKAGPEGLEKTFQDSKIEAIISPTNGPAWLIDPINGDHFRGGSSVPAALAGCPHLTVPAGFVHQLPIGLSFYGPKHTELRLLNLAFDYEQATQKRRPPRYLETVTPENP